MNNIIITHELCAEDRARLDRLAEALERKTCDTCVSGVVAAFEKKTAAESDPISEKLAETLAKAETPAEAPKNVTEATKSEPAPNDHPADEDLPWPTEPAEEKTEPTVTLEQIQQKVIQLAAGNGGAKKTAVREIINAHAKKVSDLPADKWAEVWGKLCALEKSEG